MASVQQDLPVPVLNSNSEIKRPMADYVPSIWGDQFLNYHLDEMVYTQTKKQIDELIKEVRKEMLESADHGHALQQLELINSMHRLGIAYHFKTEIEETLQRACAAYNYHEDDNLYSTSLCFRLQRQGYNNVSSDIFNKFKDDKGNFKACFQTDVPGLLALYEAAQLRIPGEDILDEALIFTTTHLEETISTTFMEGTPLAAHVSHALKQQMWKDIPRLDAKHYISIYQDIPSHNKTLLELAKLDFNLVQLLHRKELSLLSRWWKDLGLASNLSFARDILVECYFWSVAVYFEPKYSLARSILTKVIVITTIIDDVYDAYGTLEELTLFTEAIERWDISCMDQLPKYMQLCYVALLEFYEEIEVEMAKENRTYRVHYAKEAMKSLLRGYLKEAKWLNEKYIPCTIEEHWELSLLTSTYTMLITLSYIGMSDIVTRETFDWMRTDPKIVRASSMVCRLMDDIVGHKFEQRRGHVASGIECYMKQTGVGEEVAGIFFSELVVSAWKDMNEELFTTRPTTHRMPKPLLEMVVNFSRVMDVLYKVEDSFTHGGKAVKCAITSMLIEPIPLKETQ